MGFDGDVTIKRSFNRISGFFSEKSRILKNREYFRSQTIIFLNHDMFLVLFLCYEIPNFIMRYFQIVMIDR